MSKAYRRLQIDIKSEDKKRAKEIAKKIEVFVNGIEKQRFESVSVNDTTVPLEMVEDKDYF